MEFYKFIFLGELLNEALRSSNQKPTEYVYLVNGPASFSRSKENFKCSNFSV